MNKIKAIAKFGLNEILYIVYQVCKAFVAWYQNEK